MSSHHIVREKQEPALLIMQIDNFSPENLGQLLEWSPTIIVAAEAYDHAESLGIKIDGVVTSDTDFKAQEETIMIICGSNPLEDALKYFISAQYPAVNIISADFKIKDYAFYADEIDLVIFNGDRKIFPVRSGFSKWQTGGEHIEILTMPQGLDVSGMQHLHGNLFETEKDGFYHLRFDQPFIFISESV